MKFKKVLFILFFLLPCLIFTSCSCSIGGLIQFTSSSGFQTSISYQVDDDNNLIAGQNITLKMMSNSNGIITLDSTGEQNILVLPVCFKDYSLSFFNYQEDEVISNIEKAFFGSSEETGWQSVKSYYETSSYGNLTINGMVGEVFTLDINLLDFIKLTGEGSFDPSYYAIEKASENFFANYQGNLDFDKNNDGFIDALWVIYMNPYLSSKYQKQYFSWEPELKTNPNLLNKASEVLWAYTYWDYNSISSSQSIKPFVYAWASYDFLWDGNYFDDNNQPLVDAHTYIHETGHVFGLDDYYNYDYANENIPTSPTGALDMMDNNVGDHNSYSKYLLNWVKPKIIYQAGKYHLNDFQISGECLLLPSSMNSFNNSPYSEYLLFEFYSPTMLNYLDSQYRYENGIRLFGKYGVKVYHVDSRIGTLKYNYLTGSYNFIGYSNNYVNKENEYSVVGASNTPSYSYTNKRLITLLSSTHNASLNYYYQDRNLGSANDSDLFTENSKISTFKFNDGNTSTYEITFEDLTADGVNVVVKNV